MNTHSKQLGKYELQERLGRGGMAEVWKAFDPQLQRYDAIKILHANLHSDSDFMIRFVREAQVIASLRHPNIVPIHDFQITHDESSVAYMVMDYIEGRTLADYISNTSHLGKFPSAAEMVQFFASISLAVDYAHQHGIVHLAYIDNQHRNLLSTISNLLITEESASVMPNTPSLDQHTWRYNAAFPQIPSVRDHFSYLDHIRHLLAQERELDRLGLPGGVDFWFLKNVEELQKQTMEVQDQANIPDVRHHITNILYYLDGQCALQDLKNAAPDQPTQPENPALAHDATVSLLHCPQKVEPPGHLTHIQLHLHGIAQSPGATEDQKKQAEQLNTDLNTTKAWLEKVRLDAQQLAMMTDDQLGRAQALRYRMAVDARYALEGGIDPVTQKVQLSVGQLCDSIMLLASLRIMPYM